MPSHKSTVLFIDAETNDFAKRRRMLKTKHYEVLTAASGGEALRLFSTHFVDAVIIGEHVEAIDTGIMCARMKEAKPHVPIMLLSRYPGMPETALGNINAFVYHGCREEVFSAGLDRMLNLSSGFFSRWLDNWKFRVRSCHLET